MRTESFSLSESTNLPRSSGSATPSSVMIADTSEHAVLSKVGLMSAAPFATIVAGRRQEASPPLLSARVVGGGAAQRRPFSAAPRANAPPASAFPAKLFIDGDK